jgi:DNA-3-methyladenine glycosylase II
MSVYVVMAGVKPVRQTCYADIARPPGLTARGLPGTRKRARDARVIRPERKGTPNAVESQPGPSRTGPEPPSAVTAYGNGQPLDGADRHLAACDPVMRDLIRRLGPVDLDVPAARGDQFGALILAIVSQQLSTRVARAIYDRLLGQFGGRVPTAGQILAADQDQLRTLAGLSHAKSRALRSLAEHVSDGRLTLTDLPDLADEQVKGQLTAVTGIGAWTADVFLMFNLHRPDVLAAGDLGIRKAVQAQYRLAELPGIPAVTRLAEPWRPYRTRACLYLWQSLETALVPATEEEPADTLP